MIRKHLAECFESSLYGRWQRGFVGFAGVAHPYNDHGLLKEPTEDGYPALQKPAET